MGASGGNGFVVERLLCAQENDIRGANNSGWWGEAEIKFCLDGGREFPTISGAGGEDFFAVPTTPRTWRPGRLGNSTPPFAGLP